MPIQESCNMKNPLSSIIKCLSDLALLSFCLFQSENKSDTSPTDNYNHFSKEINILRDFRNSELEVNYFIGIFSINRKRMRKPQVTYDRSYNTIVGLPRIMDLNIMLNGEKSA
jgi:hypothetical protein